MNGTTFDTLSAARDLEAAGFDRTQAEALAAAIRNGQGDLSTKADLTELEARLVKWGVALAGAVIIIQITIAGIIVRILPSANIQ